MRRASALRVLACSRNGPEGRRVRMESFSIGAVPVDHLKVPISSSIVWFGQGLNRFAGAKDESVIARGFPHPPSDCSRIGCGQESGWVVFGAHPAGQVGMAE